MIIDWSEKSEVETNCLFIKPAKSKKEWSKERKRSARKTLDMQSSLMPRADPGGWNGWLVIPHFELTDKKKYKKQAFSSHILVIGQLIVTPPPFTKVTPLWKIRDPPL